MYVGMGFEATGAVGTETVPWWQEFGRAGLNIFGAWVQRPSYETRSDGTVIIRDPDRQFSQPGVSGGTGKTVAQRPPIDGATGSVGKDGANLSLSTNTILMAGMGAVILILLVSKK